MEGKNKEDAILSRHLGSRQSGEECCTPKEYRWIYLLSCLITALFLQFENVASRHAVFLDTENNAEG